MPPDELLLAAKDLERTFGHTRAVNGVDLALGSGELLAVFGPNGAGKTTLIRMLGGLVRPTKGEVLVGGRPLRSSTPATRRPIGLVSHQSFLYDDLTPLENLRFAARLYGDREPRARAARALEEVGLTAKAREPVRSLSRGMVQRVALARALLHDPSILLLDEPFTGLDARATGRVRDLLQSHLARGHAAVVVSHQFAEVWDLATHIAVMIDGRWALHESPPPTLEGFLPRYERLLYD